MPRQKIAGIFFCILSLFLGGCARYNALPLNRFVAMPNNSQPESIGFTYKIFTKREAKIFLDRDVISKGYQPIQITISNNSNRHLLFTLQSINLNCVPFEEVAESVHTSTTGRAVGYGVLGLFVWPFLIPAIVDGIGSSQANERLDADFAYKSLRDQTILPYSTVNGLIFVPINSFIPHFTITLYDQAKNETVILKAE